jgi:hypothetical protein
MTTCWRNPPVSTKRLVKVSLNAGGRFAAPKAEPSLPGWAKGRATSS